MLADYHLHTPLCRHARGSPVEYAKQALNVGLTEIGFADHNPMPSEFDDWRMRWDEFPHYLGLLDQARVECPEIPIRLGLECDFLESKGDWLDKLLSRADFDYIIGSVHYVSGGWAIDDPQYLGRWRGTAAVEEIWSEYWRLYEMMVRTRLYDIHAHPDLPKKFGLRPAGDLRKFYEPTIAALAETEGIYEINTAGLRKECAEMYPSRDFLEMAFSAGIPVIISSDSHAPEEVGMAFDQALQLIRDVGYRTTVRFEGRTRIEVPLPEKWPLPKGGEEFEQFPVDRV